MARIIHTKISKLSPFKTIIALISPTLLGTHESVKKKDLEKINFHNGWRGPAIAVAGFKNDALYHKYKNGIHRLKSRLEYGDLGVLDGHNRLSKSIEKGFAFVPVQIFPYRSKHIAIDTLLKNFTPIRVEQVVKYFKKPEMSVKPKATRHRVRGKNKRLYKIAAIQPEISITRIHLEAR